MKRESLEDMGADGKRRIKRITEKKRQGS